MAVRVAIVEDDPDMGECFQYLLKTKGYEATLFPTPGSFFDSMLKSHPDLILLDMNLPGMDGKEVIRVLRGNPQTARIPIIAVSGMQRQTKDVINGLQVGADEYLLKPVHTELLLARMQTLLRRSQPAAPAESALKIGSVSILPEQRVVRDKGGEVRLTRLEYDLLMYMMENVNRVLTRTLILDSIWHGDMNVNTRTVDKHVESLRKKLKPLREKITTIVGVGYVLKLQ